MHVSMCVYIYIYVHRSKQRNEKIDVVMSVNVCHVLCVVCRSVGYVKGRKCDTI